MIVYLLHAEFYCEPAHAIEARTTVAAICAAHGATLRGPLDNLDVFVAVPAEGDDGSTQEASAFWSEQAFVLTCTISAALARHVTHFKIRGRDGKERRYVLAPWVDTVRVATSETTYAIPRRYVPV